MKKLLFILVAFVAVVSLSSSSCEQQTKQIPTADKVQAAKTEKAMAQAVKEVGMPNIVNFKEMKDLKFIYELCDREGYICHAYLFNSMTGTVGQYLGKCYGYGVPYSTQFSNPQKLAKEYRSHQTGAYAVVLPQPEPNGVFKPEGLSATWLIMVHPKTKKPSPIYVEPEIIVSPFKLK